MYFNTASFLLYYGKCLNKAVHSVILYINNNSLKNRKQVSSWEKVSLKKNRSMAWKQLTHFCHFEQCWTKQAAGGKLISLHLQGIRFLTVSWNSSLQITSLRNIITCPRAHSQVEREESTEFRWAGSHGKTDGVSLYKEPNAEPKKGGIDL